MKKLIIRTSGFGLYFVLFLDILFISSLIYLLLAFKLLDARFLVSVLFLILILYILTSFILANKIILAEKLIIKATNIRSIIQYQIKVVEINIEDNRIIYLGNKEYLLGYLNGESVSVLNEFYNKYSHGRYGIVASIGIMLAPVIVIISHTQKTYVASTKPFSKKDITKLISELRSMNVNVAIQESLHIK